MTNWWKRIRNKRSVLFIIVCSMIAVCFHFVVIKDLLTKRQNPAKEHFVDIGLIEFTEAILFSWLPLSISVIIGFFSLYSYQLDKYRSDLYTGVAPLLILIFFVGLGLEESEIRSKYNEPSSNAILFQVANNVDGDFSGGMFIQFRTGNIFTLTDGSGLGYKWYEGRYKITGDTIVLAATNGALSNRLFIHKDSTHCPDSAVYVFKDEYGEIKTDSNFKVVFDSLFCRKK